MNRCRHGSLRGNRSKNHRGHRGHGGFYFFSRWSSSLSLRGSLGRGVFPFSVFLRVLCVLRGFHLFFLFHPSHRVRQPRRFEPPAARGTALPLRRSRVARNLIQGPTAEHRRVDRRDAVFLPSLTGGPLAPQPRFRRRSCSPGCFPRSRNTKRDDPPRASPAACPPDRATAPSAPPTTSARPPSPSGSRNAAASHRASARQTDSPPSSPLSAEAPESPQTAVSAYIPQAP